MATGLSAKNQQKPAGATESKKALSPKSKKVEFSQQVFLGGIEGELRTRGIMSDEVTRDGSPEFWDALGSFGGQLESTVEDTYPTAVDAINAFIVWLDESGWEYIAPVYFHQKGFSITLTMAAPSGQISVTGNYEVAEGAELSQAVGAAKAELQQAVIKAFPGSANRKTSPTPQSSASGPKSAEPKTESLEFDTLRIAEYNGNMVSRLMPTSGRWKQFGVAIYPDVAKKFGLEIPVTPGDYDYTGTMVYTLKDDGKPQRVISIEPSEEYEEGF